MDKSRQGDSGYTLVEILIVLALISLVAGIVYPVSHRMLERFDNYLEKNKQDEEMKNREFKSFIRDEDFESKKLQE